MSLTKLAALCTKMDTSAIAKEMKHYQSEVNVTTVTMGAGEMARHVVSPHILRNHIEFGFESDSDIDHLTETGLVISGNYIAQVHNWRVKSILGGSTKTDGITWIPFSDLFLDTPGTPLITDPHFVMKNSGDSELRVHIRTTGTCLNRDMARVPIMTECRTVIHAHEEQMRFVSHNTGLLHGMLYIHTSNYADDIRKINVVLDGVECPVDLNRTRRTVDGRTIYVIPYSDKWAWGKPPPAWISRVDIEVDLKFTGPSEQRTVTIGTYSNNVLVSHAGTAAHAFSV
jgi:hypothetical protein